MVSLLREAPSVSRMFHSRVRLDGRLLLNSEESRKQMAKVFESLDLPLTLVQEDKPNPCFSCIKHRRIKWMGHEVRT